MVEPKEHWISKVEQLKKSRNFEEAIKILDKVQEIEKEENNENFWYKKAINYVEIGEYENAKEALEKDLEINPKSYDTFFLMGKILYELKKYEESLECYNKAIEEQDSLHLRNTHKIDQMKKVHKFEEAVKYSDMVYQEKQIDNVYWRHKGMTLFKLKKFDEASSCFERVLKSDENNEKTLYELAKSELFLGKIQKSLKILEKICVINPSIREKLRIDKDFDHLADEKQFRNLAGFNI